MVEHTRLHPTKNNSLSRYLSAANMSMKKLIPSRYIDDQSILQYDWTRAFWTITCEPEFSQICALRKKIENHKIYFKLLSAKKSQNFQKTLQILFLAILLNLGRI